jgi:hypothetical protein
VFRSSAMAPKTVDARLESLKLVSVPLTAANLSAGPALTGKLRSSKGSSGRPSAQGDNEEDACIPCGSGGLMTPTRPCCAPRNDGRICPGCGDSDESVDPSNPKRTKIFGLGVRSPKTGTGLGPWCFYGTRVHLAPPAQEF